MAVRIPEMYGVRGNAGGGAGTAAGDGPACYRHATARIAAVTADLKAFWGRSYGVQKEDERALSQKHFWPDDPANAQPTKRWQKVYEMQR